MVWVIEDKIYRNNLKGNKNYVELAGGSSYWGQNYSKWKKEIQGKSILVQVSARFELVRVWVIGSWLYMKIQWSAGCEHINEKKLMSYLSYCFS